VPRGVNTRIKLSSWSRPSKTQAADGQQRTSPGFDQYRSDAPESKPPRPPTRIRVLIEKGNDRLLEYNGERRNTFPVNEQLCTTASLFAHQLDVAHLNTPGSGLQRLLIGGRFERPAYTPCTNDNPA
jgi:hypothetical protein